MDFDRQINLEHLLFFDRKCRVCKKVKNLIDDFYLSRKSRSPFASAYSYECKECTINRIIKSRKIKEKTKEILDGCEYPDW